MKWKEGSARELWVSQAEGPAWEYPGEQHLSSTESSNKKEGGKERGRMEKREGERDRRKRREKRGIFPIASCYDLERHLFFKKGNNRSKTRPAELHYQNSS